MNIKKSSTILAPAQFVYDWHTQLGAFDRLLPPWQSIDVEDVTGDFENRRIAFRFKKMGVPIRWIAQHAEVVAGKSFVDHQIEGPFKQWRHGHFFDSIAPDRTKMTDQIDFELPLHVLSGPLTGWHIKKELNQLLHYRHQQVVHDINLLYQLPLAPKVIAISGASGFIGSQLQAFLMAAGHTIKRIVRSKQPLMSDSVIGWDPDHGLLDDYQGVDMVIHLAGESIAAPIRWTKKKKQAIYDSRVLATRVLSDQLAKQPHQVSVFICASAVGFYPDSHVPMTETSPSGNDFMSTVVNDWEAATEPLASVMRVCCARFGMVLHPNGGVMKRLQPLMKAGLLGNIGDGSQFVSWISLDDAVRIYTLIAQSTASGPINIVSPVSQTQHD